MGGPNAICKQDKGILCRHQSTTAGTPSDGIARRLRLRGPALFKPVEDPQAG